MRNNCIINYLHRQSVFFRYLILLTLFAYQPSLSASHTVKEPMPSGIKATAFYSEGEAGKPAILLLLGFLQTRNYLTVNSLSTSLADEGFTILAPTLTLGISNRKRSLPCDAVQRRYDQPRRGPP